MRATIAESYRHKTVMLVQAAVQRVVLRTRCLRASCVVPLTHTASATNTTSYACISEAAQALLREPHPARISHYYA
jgi:hypothetical protein